MDIYCPVTPCGEPIELDYLHDVAEDNGTTFKEVLHDFQQRGCEALGDVHADHSEDGNMAFVAMVSDAMFDLMGDDVDGVASMMEDFEYMGML